MNDFRRRTPSRRLYPSSQSQYSNYKSELREDFNERCGYCGDHDFFRTTFYEIDHFVPKEQFKTIKANTYSNLVYSCRSCNNSKRAKWPTNDESIHNNGKVGFIDPCDQNYQEQFHRGKDGSIIADTQLGQWIYSALNFANPVHRIVWNMERLRVLIQDINTHVELGGENQEVSTDILKIVDAYFKYENELKGGNPNF